MKHKIFIEPAERELRRAPSGKTCTAKYGIAVALVSLLKNYNAIEFLEFSIPAEVGQFLQGSVARRRLPVPPGVQKLPLGAIFGVSGFNFAPLEVQRVPLGAISGSWGCFGRSKGCLWRSFWASWGPLARSRLK